MQKILGPSLAALTTAGLLATGLTAAHAQPATTAAGQLPDGTAYSVAVPTDWNGDAVILVNRPQLTGGYVA